MKFRNDCPFCEIIRDPSKHIDGADAVRHYESLPVAAFPPRTPLVPGHMLVVPMEHVADATEDSFVTATTMRGAAEWARHVGPCNIITSVGAAATQTVFHLHIHVVPRRDGDGLKLPWS